MVLPSLKSSDNHTGPEMKRNEISYSSAELTLQKMYVMPKDTKTAIYLGVEKNTSAKLAENPACAT